MNEKILTGRERKKLQTRNRILEAAAHEFRTRGFVNTSILNIMSEADLGVGTFYNYFGSKEEVLMALVKKLFRQVEKRVNELTDISSLDLLKFCCLKTARLIEDNRFILPLFTSAGEYADKPEHLPKNLSPDFKKIFEEIIRRGQLLGEIRSDIPVDMISEMFHAIFQAAAFSKIQIPFQENVRLKVQILLDGIKND